MCDQTARVLQTRRCMGFRTLFRAACVPKPGKEMLRKWFGLSTIERRCAVGELPLFGRTGEGGTKVSRCLRCLLPGDHWAGDWAEVAVISFESIGSVPISTCPILRRSCISRRLSLFEGVEQLADLLASHRRALREQVRQAAAKANAEGF